MPIIRETTAEPPKFDFSAYPADTLFHERRVRPDHRSVAEAELVCQQRVRKDRRRRVDPTTFEKQYQPDEIEFMNAMQRFKIQSGKTFPSHGEALAVALSLGYRKVSPADKA